ncbi:MAG: hypothetical protein WKG00_37160, partial [Polyangiaceae bacterium]
AKTAGAAPPSSAPDPAHPFAALSGLRARLAPASVDFDDDQAEGAWVEGLVAAAHDDLHLDAEGRILFPAAPAAVAHVAPQARPSKAARTMTDAGPPTPDAHPTAPTLVPVARLTRGASLLLPDVRLLGLTELGAGARARVQRRLQAFARDVVSDLCAPLRALSSAQLGPAARGVVYQLEQGLGTVLVRDAAEQLATLADADRARFAEAGIEVGARLVQVPALLAAQPLAVRGALCRAHAGEGAVFQAPSPRQASLRLPRGATPRLYMACGFPPYGTRAVRGDLVERVHRATREAGAAGRGQLARKVARWLACPPLEAADVLEAIADG